MNNEHPLQQPHVAAILAALEAADLTVGDAVAPRSPDGSFVAPCVVVYSRPGGSTWGTLGQADTDGDVRFQITAVGRVAAEARWYADRAHEAFIDHPIEVEARSICRVRRLSVLSSIERDDDVTPPLFYLPVEYGLFTITSPIAS